MAKLAFFISLLALGVAVLAYQEASKDLGKKIEAVRQEAADGLARLERTLRPADTPKPKP